MVRVSKPKNEQETQISTSWNRMPNEIKAKIIENMNLETRLNARICFRNFDELSNLSKKCCAEIYIRCTSEDHAEIELKERKDENTSIPIMKWTIREISKYKFQIVRTNSNGVVLSKKRTHKRFASPAAFLIAGKLFKNPIFDVKMLEMELGVTWNFYNFNLLNHPLDLLVLRNCRKKETFKGFVQSYNFNCRKIREICEGVETQQDEIERYYKEAIRSRNLLKTETTNLYLRLDQELTKAKTLKKVQDLFERFLAKFLESPFGNLIFGNVNKVVNDLMLLRAAYYIYPKEYFKEIKGNYDDTIDKLRQGIDRSQINAHVIAMISGIYLSRFSQMETFRARYYAAFQSCLEDDTKIEDTNLYYDLIYKVDWLYSRNN